MSLDSLYGIPAPPLRWHGLRIKGDIPPASAAWRDHLATRLPPGVSVDLAQETLAEAGRDLGIKFDFASLGAVPDTREAHRLVKLAEGEGAHEALVDALFSAFFERGQDIGDHEGAHHEDLDAPAQARRGDALAAFDDTPRLGADQVDAEEKRLQGWAS